MCSFNLTAGRYFNNFCFSLNFYSCSSVYHSSYCCLLLLGNSRNRKFRNRRQLSVIRNVLFQTRDLICSTNKISFSYHDRQTGMQTSTQDFLAQISQQPIIFTIAGFYGIDKTFAATVRISIQF